MRLYDKVRSSCTSKTARQTVADADVSVLLCDKIAEHYALSCADFDPKNCPYARPPWHTTFIEWVCPTKWRFSNPQNTPEYELHPDGFHYRTGRPLQLGALVQTMDVSQVRGCPPETSICLLITAFVSGDRTDVIPGKVVDCLDKDGMPLSSVLLYDEHHEIFRDFHLCINSVLLLAFTFLNCRNVKLEDITEDIQPTEKIRRRLRIPRVSRYTLNIGGYRSVSGGNSNEKDVMPFHLCRGHFATYTEQAPLFGKLVGRFWVPPHTRGNKKNGEVIKDYAILPSSE